MEKVWLSDRRIKSLNGVFPGFGLSGFLPTAFWGDPGGENTSETLPSGKS
jgi:hypothetical protein